MSWTSLRETTSSRCARAWRQRTAKTSSSMMDHSTSSTSMSRRVTTGPRTRMRNSLMEFSSSVPVSSRRSRRSASRATGARLRSDSESADSSNATISRSTRTESSTAKKRSWSLPSKTSRKLSRQRRFVAVFSTTHLKKPTMASWTVISTWRNRSYSEECFFEISVSWVCQSNKMSSLTFCISLSEFKTQKQVLSKLASKN